MGDSNNPNILDKETVSICFFSFSWFLGRGKEGKRGGRVHRGHAQEMYRAGIVFCSIGKGIFRWDI